MIPYIEKSELIFDNFLKIKRDVLRLPGAAAYSYFTLMPPSDAVSILTINKEGHLVLTEEYRHPTGETVLGTAGGYLNASESPIAAAKRELEEETGYTADAYCLMGSSFPYPGISNQKIYYVLAKNAVLSHSQQLEPSEIMKVTIKTVSETEELIKKGSVPIDGILCTALLYFKLYTH